MNVDTAALSGVILTEQQRRALGLPGASVALSAGAGCGKTMVLTERFLTALDDDGGRPLAALVALTFTEKAARELRQRIRARCRSRLASGDETDPGRWWAALRGLEAAPIGTFHEFCARLLRRYALLAGVDPEFAILDESIAGALRDQAVRVAIRKMLAEKDEDLIDLAGEFGLHQVREALGRLVTLRTAVDLEDWASRDPVEIADLWRAASDDRLRPALLERARPLADRCRRLLEALESDSAKIRERKIVLLDGFRIILDPDALPCPIDRLEELTELAKVQGMPRSQWPSVEIYEAIRDAFAEFRDHLKKQVIPSLDWSDEEALQGAADRSVRFARLALAVRREHERLKRVRRGLDFDDLLIKARQLLRDHPELAGAIAEGEEPPILPGRPTGVEFVLVDEFQDTDAIQGEMLRWLGGPRFLEGRLFVVGDVKQSIYRFRGAEPLIFSRWRSEFPSHGRLELSENFRSVPGIIGFVNALFRDAFRDIDPSGSAEVDHRLRPIRPADTCRPSVEFLWPDLGEESRAGAFEGDEPPPPKRSARERRVIEARCIARRLRERLDAGWPVFDRETRTVRPAHPGDVAMLFRAMTDLWPYETALADEGFEYHTIGGSAFYAQQEVHDVINLLSVVEDPFDEIALAGALRSPFFGVSDEGLFRLATAFPDGGLTVGLYRLDAVAKLTGTDRARASRAVELLDRWRAEKDRLPMARLVSRILDESGFEAALVCEFLGDRKLANIRKIVRLARGFDRQGGFTLAEFVERLRADLENEPREEQAATTDEAGASIRLMSIHQAKGLEFPIVVLPDLARAPSMRSPLLACRPDLGLVVRPPGALPTEGDDDARDPAWRAYRALERIDDERESLRLFYVAATRARDALILSAGLGPDEAVKSTSIAMRLLDECFDRRDGACRVPAAPDDPCPVPEVGVCLMKPPEPRGESGPGSQAPARPRLSLAAIEEIITKRDGSAGASTQADPAPPTPRYLDLDRPSGRSNRAVRLDELIRAAIRDPRWRRREPPSTQELVSRAGARQVPSAGPGLIREAVRRLDALWGLSAFRALRASASGPADVCDDLELNALVDDGQARPSTVHGRCDLAFRDHEGRWNVIVVDDEHAGPDLPRLRLRLAARAAHALGLMPISRGWLVRHGPDGGASEELLNITDGGEMT